MAIFYGGAPDPQLSAMPVPRLILYQRDDCHLCDLALAELAAVRAPAFESVFIDDDALLEASYGTRVPVLRDAATGRELDWPFDVPALERFLRGEAGAAGAAS